MMRSAPAFHPAVDAARDSDRVTCRPPAGANDADCGSDPVSCTPSFQERTMVIVVLIGQRAVRPLERLNYAPAKAGGFCWPLKAAGQAEACSNVQGLQAP